MELSPGSFTATGLSQGTQGIIIGEAQPPGTPTHDGTPLPTDWNPITAPYSWFGQTAEEYTTSPITGSTETGLDFSGWQWSWDGINPDLSSGAWGTGYTNGIANFTWDGAYGDSYTLEYHATVPPGSPTGFGGVHVDYHLEGVVLQPVPLPSTAWLFSSGLIGMLGLVRRKK